MVTVTTAAAAAATTTTAATTHCPINIKCGAVIIEQTSILYNIHSCICNYQ
jgi:hypothetical protein